MVDVQYITRAPPIFLNPFFYVAVALLLALAFYLVYHYISIHVKNRTGVRIHMPDASIKTYWYKKGTIGNELKIQSAEKTQDGTPIFHTYFFKPECVEHGKWGDYIDYDYKISEPINPRNRQRDNSFLRNMLEFVSGLLDTDLAVDLLLSQKFKEFVTTMLIIILIVSVIGVIAGIASNFTNPQVVNCNLIPSNQTLQTLRLGLTVAQ